MDAYFRRFMHPSLSILQTYLTAADVFVTYRRTLILSNDVTTQLINDVVEPAQKSTKLSYFKTHDDAGLFWKRVSASHTQNNKKNPPSQSKQWQLSRSSVSKTVSDDHNCFRKKKKERKKELKEKADKKEKQ
ncbi:hypothetical protein C0J52_20663 [Blattella germanica]|nr:hypothetical protein C0J52_20663 [Blattella germanica]